jgi:large subunit ribosomal protein L23
MALLDFLKKKENKEKSAIKKTAKKVEKISVEKKSTENKPAASLKKFGFSYNIIKEPHISEKATILAEKSNHFTFKVSGRANKSEIKKSVEGVYGVNVLSVNIIKIPAKKRRLGRTEGYRKGYTKAVIKIAEGQKIEIL